MGEIVGLLVLLFPVGFLEGVVLPGVLCLVETLEVGGIALFVF